MIMIKLLFSLMIILYVLYISKYNADYITKIIRKIYINNFNSVSVYMIAGLGNRLMSFAGIIILSIFFESKPKSIILNIIS